MKTNVIGAAASGLLAAIAAANAGSSVTVIEHNKQVGKKILITGDVYKRQTKSMRRI